MPSLIERVATRFRMHILRDPFLLALQQWHRDGGDEKLQFRYPLNPDSLVWDVGGFRGAWSREISDRYACRIHIFEPMPDFVTDLEQRFRGNEKISIFPYALSDSSGTAIFNDRGEGSSAFMPSDHQVLCEKRDITEALAGVQGDIDVMKINIEGGEYAVLPALLRRGIERVRFLTIQFHKFIPGAEAMRNAIRAELAKTHRETWCYYFVWETWQRK